MVDEHREVNVSGPHNPLEDPHRFLSRKKSQILTSMRAPPHHADLSGAAEQGSKADGQLQNLEPAPDLGSGLRRL